MVKLVIFKIKVDKQLNHELEMRLENNLEGADTRYTPILVLQRQGIPEEWQGWLILDSFMFFVTVVQLIALTLQ
jgi:hypothetical protein